MAETEQLSQTTTELLQKAVRESEQLEDGDSLDRVLSHITRTYLIANMHSEELAELEEATDLAAERRRELHEKRRSELSGTRARDSSSQAKRLSELRERAEKAQGKDGVQHDGEGLTAGEYFKQRERAREWVGLDPSPNSE